MKGSVDKIMLAGLSFTVLLVSEMAESYQRDMFCSAKQWKDECLARKDFIETFDSLRLDACKAFCRDNKKCRSIVYDDKTLECGLLRRSVENYSEKAYSRLQQPKTSSSDEQKACITKYVAHIKQFTSNFLQSKVSHFLETIPQEDG